MKITETTPSEPTGPSLTDIIYRLENEIEHAKANNRFDYIFAISISDAIFLVDKLKEKDNANVSG